MKRQPHGGRERSICKGPGAGMSVTYAGYKEKGMGLEPSECRGEETKVKTEARRSQVV